MGTNTSSIGRTNSGSLIDPENIDTGVYGTADKVADRLHAANDKAGGAEDTFERGVDRAEAKASEVKNTAQDSAGAVEDAAKDKADAAADQAKDGVEVAKAKAGAAADQAKTKAGAAADQAKDGVEVAKAKAGAAADQAKTGASRVIQALKPYLGTLGTLASTAATARGVHLMTTAQAGAPQAAMGQSAAWLLGGLGALTTTLAKTAPKGSEAAWTQALIQGGTALHAFGNATSLRPYTGTGSVACISGAAALGSALWQKHRGNPTASVQPQLQSLTAMVVGLASSHVFAGHYLNRNWVPALSALSVLLTALVKLSPEPAVAA